MRGHIIRDKINKINRGHFHVFISNFNKYKYDLIFKSNSPRQYEWNEWLGTHWTGITPREQIHHDGRDSKSDREKKNKKTKTYCSIALSKCRKIHEHFYRHVIKIVQLTFFHVCVVCLFAFLVGWPAARCGITCPVYMLEMFFFPSINNIFKMVRVFFFRKCFNSLRSCFACVHSLRLPQILTKITVFPLIEVTTVCLFVCLSFFTSLTQENNNVWLFLCPVNGGWHVQFPFYFPKLKYAAI